MTTASKIVQRGLAALGVSHEPVVLVAGERDVAHAARDRLPRCQIRSRGSQAEQPWPRRWASRIIAKVESL